MSLKRIRPIFTALAFAVLVACTSSQNLSGNDPKQRLTEYVNLSFNAHSAGDRDKLLAFLTGGAKNRLLAWSEEQFRQAFIDVDRKFLKLAIREEKRVSSSETNITYELSYNDKAKGADARVTNRRMCEMVLENGKWYIREVHNIKELIEYKNEMSLP